MPIHMQELLLPTMSIAEKLLRTLVVYLALLALLRFSGKREMGQLNPFDLVVLLLLSNTVQNAIIGEEYTLTGGLIGASALVIINWLVARVLYHRPGLKKLIEGEPDCLISDGKILHDNLKRETITIAELELAARREGFAGLEDVESCRLEVEGDLTFIARHPTKTEERHDELLVRLDALVAAQARLVERLDTMQGGSRA